MSGAAGDRGEGSPEAPRRAHKRSRSDSLDTTPYVSPLASASLLAILPPEIIWRIGGHLATDFRSYVRFTLVARGTRHGVWSGADETTIARLRTAFQAFVQSRGSSIPSWLMPIVDYLNEAGHPLCRLSPLVGFLLDPAILGLVEDKMSNLFIDCVQAGLFVHALEERKVNGLVAIRPANVPSSDNLRHLVASRDFRSLRNIIRLYPAVELRRSSPLLSSFPSAISYEDASLLINDLKMSARQFEVPSISSDLPDLGLFRAIANIERAFICSPDGAGLCLSIIEGLRTAAVVACAISDVWAREALDLARDFARLAHNRLSFWAGQPDQFVEKQLRLGATVTDIHHLAEIHRSGFFSNERFLKLVSTFSSSREVDAFVIRFANRMRGGFGKLYGDLLDAITRVRREDYSAALIEIMRQGKRIPEALLSLACQDSRAHLREFRGFLMSAEAAVRCKNAALSLREEFYSKDREPPRAPKEVVDRALRTADWLASCAMRSDPRISSWSMLPTQRVEEILGGYAESGRIDGIRDIESSGVLGESFLVTLCKSAYNDDTMTFALAHPNLTSRGLGRLVQCCCIRNTPSDSIAAVIRRAALRERPVKLPLRDLLGRLDWSARDVLTVLQALSSETNWFLTWPYARSAVDLLFDPPPEADPTTLRVVCQWTTGAASFRVHGEERQFLQTKVTRLIQQMLGRVASGGGRGTGPPFMKDQEILGRLFKFVPIGSYNDRILDVFGKGSDGNDDALDVLPTLLSHVSVPWGQHGLPAEFKNAVAELKRRRGSEPRVLRVLERLDVIIRRKDSESWPGLFVYDVPVK